MNKLQQQILNSALPMVVFEGWTMQMLERAAVEAGLPSIDARRAFPKGVSQCLTLFSEDADAAMLKTLKEEYHLESMKIRERIATAVMVRLRQNQPYREAIRRGLAYYSLPWNAAYGMRTLYHTVDAMWRAAGDNSTDFNFYTKRSLLAKVYMSTLYVWLSDESDNLEETQAFLYRRIEDVMQVQKWKGKCSKLLDDFSLSSFARPTQE